MDYRTPEKGIQEVSVCKFSKTLTTVNSETKENKKKRNSDYVEDLKKEISDLKGRLCEARSSRDAALRKNSVMQESHLTSLKQLQEVIDKLETKNKILQKERDVDVYEQLKLCEEELERTRRERNHLAQKLDGVTRESSEREVKLTELHQRIKKLEQCVSNLETQKEDLVRTAQDYVQKGNEFEMQKGALEVLQKQLDKYHESWNQVKDQLSDQRGRNRDLERTLAGVEKELTTFKVDVRLLTKQKKELEEKLTKEISSKNSTHDHFKEILSAKLAGERKVAELEREVDSLKTQILALNEFGKQRDQVIQEQKENQAKLVSNLESARKEARKMNDSVRTHEELKANLEKLKTSITEKDQMLVEKEKSIEKLQLGGAKLKNACVLLENQLKEFEKLLSKQQQDLSNYQKHGEEAENKISTLQEELRKTKIALNETTSLKLFTEKKLADFERTLKTGESERITEIQNLKTRIVDLKRSNDLLTEKMSDLLDKLDEFQLLNDDLAKKSDSLQSENKLLKEESTRLLTQVMTLKEANVKLTSALEEAVTKCEKYKDRLESVSEDLALFEVGQAEKELRLQSALNQQIKLIEHLKDQNEHLSAKKKKHFGGKFFTRDHKEHKEQSTPLSHLTKPIPNSTPRRLIQEHKVVKNLEEEAAYLKNQLARLQTQKDVPAEANDYISDKDSVTSEEELIDPKEIGVQKSLIFSAEGCDRLDVNCIKSITDHLYMLGCEQGLYSRKVYEGKPLNYVVAIEGPGSVYQIEFIISLNMAVLIEGKDRRLALVHLSLLRACAEAAACAKPKLKLQYFSDLKNCHNIHIHKSLEGTVYIVAASQKHMNILFWDKDSFVLRHSLKTPSTVTCVLPTPNSVIYGCDKIFELDLKNFTTEEFMDESDESMMYAMLACRESVNFPVAMLDVSRSTVTAAGSNMTTEYLLCFPDMAIFTDAYGRRSRSEDIMWSKLPLGVYYRHPNLFVVHFNSVEIIPIQPKSFTKTRVITSVDSIGKEVVNIPESRFIALPNARFLGNGVNGPSLVIGTVTKTKFEVYEITCASGD
ncbi:unnamed protein product [Allacma fusca]|uniref:CNH domain-containing protein n=1 Tax=Allacma fusca TaxID=39272 RepID=A0A8J2PK92_9HEXA|nr:unnamed protein product [Allacma fusca]